MFLCHHIQASSQNKSNITFSPYGFLKLIYHLLWDYHLLAIVYSQYLSQQINLFNLRNQSKCQKKGHISRCGSIRSKFRIFSRSIYKQTPKFVIQNRCFISKLELHFIILINANIYYTRIRLNKH